MIRYPERIRRFDGYATLLIDSTRRRRCLKRERERKIVATSAYRWWLRAIV